MVPLRFVAEALGADVQYDTAKHAIRITSAEALLKKELEAWEKEQEANKPKALTTKQIVDQNDGKIVMITTEIGQGSGVVVGKDGLQRIITSSSIRPKGSAMLLNGKEVELEGIVGYDEESDLAVVKTKTPLNIEPVAIGLEASKVITSSPSAARSASKTPCRTALSATSRTRATRNITRRAPRSTTAAPAAACSTISAS